MNAALDDFERREDGSAERPWMPPCVQEAQEDLAEIAEVLRCTILTCKSLEAHLDRERSHVKDLKARLVLLQRIADEDADTKEFNDSPFGLGA